MEATSLEGEAGQAGPSVRKTAESFRNVSLAGIFFLLGGTEGTSACWSNRWLSSWCFPPWRCRFWRAFSRWRARSNVKGLGRLSALLSRSVWGPPPPTSTFISCPPRQALWVDVIVHQWETGEVTSSSTNGKPVGLPIKGTARALLVPAHGSWLPATSSVVGWPGNSFVACVQPCTGATVRTWLCRAGLRIRWTSLKRCSPIKTTTGGILWPLWCGWPPITRQMRKAYPWAIPTWHALLRRRLGLFLLQPWGPKRRRRPRRRRSHHHLPGANSTKIRVVRGV